METRFTLIKESKSSRRRTIWTWRPLPRRAGFVRNRRRIWAALLCAMAAFTAIHCRAQTTNYSTLVEPGDGYNSESVYFVIGSSENVGGNGYQSLGFEFTPTASGYLQQINLAVFAGNVNVTEDDADIYVEAGSRTLPGDALTLESFLNVPVAQGSATDIPLTSVDSVAHPYLQSGVAYWLLVEAANPDGFLLAYQTVDGITAPLAAQFSPTGNWDAEGTRGTLAYDVLVSSSVPEPSTWILVMMGGAALLKFRLGQKKHG